MEVRRGAVTNYFEVFGGKDEASYTLIQGRTLAGVLLDEVVLMPRSFVEQALARCSVDGAKLWFSCNPGSPHHWFYQEWIKRHRERNTLYLDVYKRQGKALSGIHLTREFVFAGGADMLRVHRAKTCLLYTSRVISAGEPANTSQTRVASASGAR